MTAEDVLRVLAPGDVREERGGCRDLSASVGPVNDWTQAAAEVAALVALCASDASFAVAIDRAIGAGLTTSELVALILWLVPTVGAARLVDLAPDLALGLASISTSCWSHTARSAPVHNPDGRHSSTARSCASSDRGAAHRPKVVQAIGARRSPQQVNLVRTEGAVTQCV